MAAKFQIFAVFMKTGRLMKITMEYIIIAYKILYKKYIMQFYNTSDSLQDI